MTNQMARVVSSGGFSGGLFSRKWWVCLNVINAVVGSGGLSEKLRTRENQPHAFSTLANFSADPQTHHDPPRLLCLPGRKEFCLMSAETIGTPPTPNPRTGHAHGPQAVLPPDARRRSVAGSRVRSRWTTIIGAMLTSRTDAEAAALAGVSLRTIARLKHDQEFMDDLRTAKDAQLDGAIDRLRGNAELFTNTLSEIAADGKQHGNARVRASEVGLNTLLKAVELQDIVRRLARLETAAGDTNRS